MQELVAVVHLIVLEDVLHTQKLMPTAQLHIVHVVVIVLDAAAVEMLVDGVVLENALDVQVDVLMDVLVLVLMDVVTLVLEVVKMLVKALVKMPVREAVQMPVRIIVDIYVIQRVRAM
jgi:hypothetical protein